ncbi:MAG: hypothetical protein QUS14_15330 [Pyrinomonadaceae bacterium]|nr:hypothetical protein [Pyrinomonadaceae bacterium]
MFSGTLLLVMLAVSGVAGQQVVDKTVASVSDGVRTELITLSDLKWQLALQPNVSLGSPASVDLNRALQLQIDQRLIALEAERLPSNPPSDAEIAAKIAEILKYFPSTAEFETRLRSVGFTSIKDANFEQIIRQRIAIDKYLDFRFRSFIVVTPQDEEAYYRDIFVPDFRRRFPGLVPPELEEKRAEIRQILTEERVEAAIITFLDEARNRAEIIIISEV